jgi:hypothetical protein
VFALGPFCTYKKAPLFYLLGVRFTQPFFHTPTEWVPVEKKRKGGELNIVSSSESSGNEAMRVAEWCI